MASPSGRTLMRVAGVIAWAFAGIPAIAQICLEPGCLTGAPLITWFASFGAFGVSFWLATGAIGRPRISSWTIAYLVFQTVAASIMLSFICSGFEATLLMVVAAQLGVLLPLRVGLPWIIAQSTLMGWLVTLQWQRDWSPAYWLLGAIGVQAFAFVIARIAGSEAEARRELAQANAELRATRELLTLSSKSAERLRVSRELHDLIGHDLAALNLHLEAAKHLAEGKATEPVAKARGAAKQLLADVRSAVTSMRQDQAVDLTQALHALCDPITSPTVHLELPESVHVADPERANALIRCVQEVITNTLKHAKADNLWITVTAHDDGLEVSARDDGRGAAELRIGNGLQGMRERLEQLGGTLKIESAAERGFRIDAWVPPAGEPA